jgi:hypothetical protein
MSRDSTVIPDRQPEAIDDPLTEVAREGARAPVPAIDDEFAITARCRSQMTCRGGRSLRRIGAVAADPDRGAAR